MPGLPARAGLHRLDRSADRRFRRRVRFRSSPNTAQGYRSVWNLSTRRARCAPYQLPPRDLLEPPPPFPIQDHETQIHARAMLLERTLLDFGYKVRVVQIDTGPVITQFEIELEAGLRVSGS